MGKIQTYRGKPVRKQYAIDNDHMMVVLYEKDAKDKEKNKRLVVTKADWRQYSQKREFTDDTRRCDVVKTNSCVGMKNNVKELIRYFGFSPGHN